MQHRRRAVFVATLFVAACGGATVAVTDVGEPSPPSSTVTDGGALDAPSDARARDVATDIPLLDERPCREAGTIFECLDCCDLLYPPGQQIYTEALDRCSCESCPTCAGSFVCTTDDDAPAGSSKCHDCVDGTREHDGPYSCHPKAQEACDEYANCIAAQRCMVRSRCLTKPAQ